MGEPRKARQKGFTSDERARYRIRMLHVNTTSRFVDLLSGFRAERAMKWADSDGDYNLANMPAGRITSVDFELVRAPNRKSFPYSVKVSWREFDERGRRAALIMQKAGDYSFSGKKMGKKAWEQLF